MQNRPFWATGSTGKKGWPRPTYTRTPEPPCTFSMSSCRPSTPPAWTSPATPPICKCGSGWQRIASHKASGFIYFILPSLTVRASAKVPRLNEIARLNVRSIALAAHLNTNKQKINWLTNLKHAHQGLSNYELRS